MSINHRVKAIKINISLTNYGIYAKIMLHVENNLKKNEKIFKIQNNPGSSKAA
jgi:hypothetical protein